MKTNNSKKEKRKSRAAYVISALILLIAAAIGATAYYIGYYVSADGVTEPAVDFYKGAWYNNVYQNEFAGLKFNLPDDMKIYTGKNAVDLRKDATAGFRAVGDDDNETVSLDFIDLSKSYMGQLKTAEDYAGLLNKSVRAANGLTVDSEAYEPENVVIGTRNYKKAYEYANDNGYRCAAFCERIGSYICLITVETKGEVGSRLDFFEEFTSDDIIPNEYRRQ